MELQQQSTNFWKPAAIGSIFLALLNVYQPASDLFKVVFVEDANKVLSQRVKEWQSVLRERNAACSLEMPQTITKVGEQLEVRFGACPNQNVRVSLYPKGSSAYEYWLEPNEKVGVAQVGSLFSPGLRSQRGTIRGGRAIAKPGCGDPRADGDEDRVPGPEQR